ncbi:hypothetical protein BH11MYX2_BH11MYX2_05780 [soil metagenome]
MRFALASLLVIAACSGDDDGSDADDVAGDDGSAADPCDACSADQVCVQEFDGVCMAHGVACVAKTIECPLTGSCSDECFNAYCSGAPYQCTNRDSCGGESPRAFTCYGP